MSMLNVTHVPELQNVFNYFYSSQSELDLLPNVTMAINKMTLTIASLDIQINLSAKKVLLAPNFLSFISRQNVSLILFNLKFLLNDSKLYTDKNAQLMLKSNSFMSFPTQNVNSSIKKSYKTLNYRFAFIIV